MASCSDTKFLEAIQEVETGGLEDPSKAVGDQGRSIGPLQIMKGYYDDAVQQDPSLTEGGKTYQDVTDVEYARKVLIAYMKRYATEGRLGRKPTYMKTLPASTMVDQMDTRSQQLTNTGTKSKAIWTSSARVDTQYNG